MSEFGLPLFDWSAATPAASSNPWHAPQRAKRGPSWCGPYAVAVVAGMSYEGGLAACEAIGTHKAKRSGKVEGMFQFELVKAIRKAGKKCRSWSYNETRLEENCEVAYKFTEEGWHYKPAKRMKQLTVAGFIKHKAQPGVTYVLSASSHFLTLRDGRTICNQQPEWKDAKARKGRGSYRRALVYGVVEILPDPY